MAVPVTIVDLSVTAASNSPAGADAVASGTGPDDYLRALSAIVRREQAQATAVASATTVDLGAIATGNYVHITGTTTITGFGTVAAGVERTVVFDGALTLTHNATSLILPGGANITTAAGDCAMLRSEGSGNWRCVNYEKYGNSVSNVVSSRALTTTYTNTSGSPIAVNIVLSVGNSDPSFVYVDTTLVSRVLVDATGTHIHSHFVIVPPGKTYYANVALGSLLGWVETQFI